MLTPKQELEVLKRSPTLQARVMEHKLRVETEELEVLKRAPTTLQAKVLEHKLRVEDEKLDTTWRSCLGCNSDARLTQFFTRITIIVMVMVFSMYQLLTQESCPSQQAYMGLLTLLLGLIIPTPLGNASNTGRKKTNEESSKK